MFDILGVFTVRPDILCEKYKKCFQYMVNLNNLYVHKVLLDT